jgi:DNA-binding NtrC family response regulator
MNGNVLIIDDDMNMCELIETDLSLRGFSCTWFTSPNKALEAVKDQPFDVVLTDLRMPGKDGIKLCDEMVTDHPDIPVVLMTAFGSLETAIAAIRAGAFDFIPKPMELDLLALVLERAVHHRRLKQEVKTLSEAVRQQGTFDRIIGASSSMKKVYERIERIMDTEISVLIVGETGTGKELIARTLHKQSPRSDGPFIAVNCAALPDSLLESELFGHTRGAFTDAKTAHKGLFAQAEGGTLFLDEIGDFPLTLQPKLLRALEEHSIRPVGAESEVNVDVRLLTATNQDLEFLVKEGKFREDLYFRINVMQLETPPLRSRFTDILLLAQHFIEHFAKKYNKNVTGIAETVSEKLLDYEWPGNVRELKNLIERAVALTQHEKIIMTDLPKKIRSSNKIAIDADYLDPSDFLTIEEMEHRYIQQVLKTIGGNQTKAAKILGIDRKTLYRKMLRSDEK